MAHSIKLYIKFSNLLEHIRDDLHLVQFFCKTIGLIFMKSELESNL